MLLRDGDHGFYGDGAVDDGCGWGQSERLQQGVEGAAGAEANDAFGEDFEERFDVGWAYNFVQRGENGEQVGVADV